MTTFRLGPARLLCSFDESRRCADTLYSPFILIDPAPAIAGMNEVLYTMGGHLDGGTNFLYGSAERFADKIYYSARRDATQPMSVPTAIIQKSTFPWMQNPEAWLMQHRESFVGAVASPSVLKLAPKRYVMAFCATVSDPNICAGEHGGATPYGSCLTPWSFFVLYFATSEDGLTWRLERPYNRVPAQLNAAESIAFDGAALWYYPSPMDRDVNLVVGGTKGVVAVTMNKDDEFLYLCIDFWGAAGVKSTMTRTRYDRTQPVGHTWEFEIFDTDGWHWSPCIQGRLPRWLNDVPWRGQIFGASIEQITRSSRVPGKFFATALGRFNPSGSDSQLAVTSSADLLHWDDITLVEGAPPFVYNPIYYEDAAGGAHFAWANPPAGGCPGNIPYYGLGIYVADVLA